MGSKSSPSASVCNHSLDAVPIDSLVHQVFFKCRPPSLRWTTSSSATTTRGPWHGVIGWSSRWHPDDMACHPKSSATMSCNLRCPVWLSTFMLVTWSFHVMPRTLTFLAFWCYNILNVHSYFYLLWFLGQLLSCKLKCRPFVVAVCLSVCPSVRLSQMYYG